MERVKQIWEKVKNFFKSMSLRVRIILAAVLLLTVALITFLIIKANQRPYEVLFTGLSTEDMTAVVQYLESANVRDYRVRDNNTIMVKEGQAPALQAQLLLQGYPSSSYKYGMYLDNVGLLSSDSDRQRLAVFDLQEHLNRIIESMENVQNAEVMITMGKSSAYILDSDEITEAKAAVTVAMRRGTVLTNGQVEAIRNAVSNAVQGLEFEKVSIQDTVGNVYSLEDEQADMNDNTALKMSLQKQVNEQVRENVIAVLAPLFGPENVSVSVNSTVDINRTYQESVIHGTPDGPSRSDLGIHGLIGEYVWDGGYSTAGDQTVGGVVGTTTNADLNEYVINEGEGAAGEVVGASGSVVYENDKVVTQTEGAGGIITDVMVAVSINRTGTGEVNTEALIPLVARAAGIDTEVQRQKVTIVAQPFYQEGEIVPPAVEGNVPNVVIYGALGGLILLLIIIIVVLLILRRRKQKQEEEAAAAAAEEAARLAAEAAEEAARLEAEAAAAALEEAQAADGADIMDIHTERTMELRKNVRQFVEENPEIAAQMVRTWLRGGEENA